MATSTTQENEMTGRSIEEVVAWAEDRARENRQRYGLDVRCPTCNHGIGKFCHESPGSPHLSADDIALHPARVEAARAAGFID